MRYDWLAVMSLYTTPHELPPLNLTLPSSQSFLDTPILTRCFSVDDDGAALEEDEDDSEEGSRSNPALTSLKWLRITKTVQLERVRVQ